MKCDLHVHTIHSGMCTVPVAKTFCRESYSDPEAVYERLKRAGMDLVTITDHDSIGAAERLRRHADFFLSVEATCRMPSGTEVHVGVYDVTEKQHLEVQRRREDFFALIAYLNEQRLFFSANHVFSGLTGRRELSDFYWFERDFPSFETRNGAMLSGANSRAAQLAAMMQKAPVGGSDAHTLPSLASTFTRVSGAKDKAEFLAGLRQQRGVVCGDSGSFLKLTRDVLLICGLLMRERPYLLPIAPVLAAVPAVTLINWCLEAAFAERWFARVAGWQHGGAIPALDAGEVSA